jgi:hypothetical protein
MFVSIWIKGILGLREKAKWEQIVAKCGEEYKH